MTAPRFPPELERIIFETAAWNDMRTMQSLVLVAHRVCIWIEPLLYRVVRIADEKSLSRIQNLIQKKPALAKKHITHLMVLASAGRETIQPILTACPNLSDLFLGSSKIYPEMLDDLQLLTHLQRLSVDLQTLFRRGQPASMLVLPPPDRLAPLQLLTHLHLSGGLPDELLRMINSTTFPALTHIAHPSFYIERVPTSILRTCGQLQLLVCYYLPNSAKKALDLEVRISDPRFCVVEYQLHRREWEPAVWGEWEPAVWGEEDLWSLAEKRIAARASRLVE
ncbi:hypothetical protein C8F01DRAFT_1371059 [Mycena amicta]|nr:hypothetical protein C8F01DRAFT_1371059 [Mycena amicta]